MTLLISAFDSPNSTYAPIQGLSGVGVAIAGASNPQGIADVLTLENGVMRAYCSDAHALTSGGHRTEIYFLPDTFGVESWYTWDFLLPSDYWTGFTGIITIGQFHDSPNAGNSTPRQPNFMLQFNNKNLQVTWPKAVLPTEQSSSRQAPGVNLDFDRWYSMCIRFSWKTDATGFREVFVNRTPVYREWGVPTSYNDTVAPYFKLGMYFTNNLNPCGEKVLYVKNLKRWSGNDGYQAVMGGAPLTPPKISQV